MQYEPIVRMDRCRVCGADDWLEVISFGSTPLANGFLDPAVAAGPEPSFPVDVVVCRDCRLMSLRHVVDPEVLFRNYCYVSSGSDTIRSHMERIAAWCTGKAGLTGDDLVVEMGSNIGLQLRVFADQGRRVIGVDPARNLARVAEESGVPTIAEFFGPEVTGSVAREHGTAKLVLGRQCFAHIHDLHSVMKGVDAVLAADGILAIEVPYLLDLLEQNQFDTIYHEHLSYLSVHTMQRLFGAYGLRVVDVERADVHGGSVVVFAARTESGRPPSAAVDAILDLERRHGLDGDRAYLEFADRARTLIADIRDLVRDLAGQGRRIAGYGAPSKGTALLMVCGLTAAEIEYCTDTTPSKIGKLLPGLHVPVLSPEQAKARPPDYFLLLAWNYAPEIIRNEQAFLQNGGGFIVPIPQPRVTTADDGPVDGAEPVAMSITTPAGTFDALAAGPVDGRPVLLLHGFPQGALEWRAQLRALAAAGYRAIAPDQRGYSPGVRPAEVAAYAMDELVADALAIVDALGWDQFDLVGHDWGAAIGWIVADRHPQRVRTLTAVSVPHPEAFAAALRDDPEQQQRSAYLEMFRQPGAAEQMMLANDAAMVRGMLQQAVPADTVEEYVTRLRAPGAVTAALNWYRATRPDETRVAATTVPTLYVWGSADAGVGATAAGGTSAWVTAPYRFETFDGVSHWVPEQAANRLNDVLLTHLAAHPR